LLALLLLWTWAPPEGTQVRDELRGVASGVGALLVLYAPLFLINMFAVPPAMEQESTDEWQAMTKHLLSQLDADKAERASLELEQWIFDSLGELVMEGVQLRRRVAGNSDLDALELEFLEWVGNVTKFVKQHCGAGHMASFYDEDAFNPPEPAGLSADEYQVWWSIAPRIQALQSICQQFTPQRASHTLPDPS